MLIVLILALKRGYIPHPRGALTGASRIKCKFRYLHIRTTLHVFLSSDIATNASALEMNRTKSNQETTSPSLHVPYQHRTYHSKQHTQPPLRRSRDRNPSCLDMGSRATHMRHLSLTQIQLGARALEGCAQLAFRIIVTIFGSTATLVVFGGIAALVVGAHAAEL